MRVRMQTCKIILVTSLIWFLIDVVLLIYYTDYGSSIDNKGPSADSLVHNDNRKVETINGHHDEDEGVENNHVSL